MRLNIIFIQFLDKHGVIIDKHAEIHLNDRKF